MTDEALRMAVAGWLAGMDPAKQARALAAAQTVLLWLEQNDPKGYAAVLRGDVVEARAALERLAGAGGRGERAA